MCTGQHAQALALLVVVEADGAGVVGVTLAELAGGDLAERPVGEAVAPRPPPVFYAFYYLGKNII